MLEHIDRSIYNRIENIKECSRNSIAQRVVTRSNKEFEKLGNVRAYIDQKDHEWTSVPKNEITRPMQELINGTLSEELREKLNFYEKEYGYKVFGEIFLTNKYGANVAQTGKTTDYYQADEKWWQEAKKNGLYVADVEYDESADVYSTDICIRIDDQTGNFLGIIKAVLNIEETFKIIKTEEEEHMAAGYKLLTKDSKILYATGEYEFLGSLPEKLVTHLDEENVQEHLTHYFLSEADKPDGEDNIFAHTHSKGYKDYKGLGWTLMVEYDTEEIFAPVAKLKTYIFIVSLLIIMGAFVLSFFISRSVSNPIKKLIDATSKIGEGNLETQVEIKSDNEIGQLGASFNKMTEALKNTTTSIDNLNREITERKQAEEERDRILSSSQDLICIAGMDGFFKYVNPAWEKSLGYTRDELLSKPFLDFIHPDDHKMNDQEMEKLSAGQQIFDFENRYLCKDGSIRYIQWTATPFLNEAVMYCIGRDITKGKQVEEQIRRQNILLRVIDRLFQQTLKSDSLEAIAQTCLTEVEELTGSKFGFIGELNQAGLFDTLAISNPGWDTCKMPRSEATKAMKNMKLRGIDRTALKDGKSRIVNEPASHPDRVGTPEGHPSITSFLGVPLLHKGRTVGMIGLANKEGGYSLDDQQNVETLSTAFGGILCQKRMEESLRVKEEKLRNEQKNLESLISASPVGILLIDETGTVKHINDIVEKMVGKKSSDMIDIPLGEALSCLHASDVPEGCGHGPACSACPIRHIVQKALLLGEPMGRIEVQRTFLVDGQEMNPWIEISAEPLTIDDTKHVVIAIQNITERKTIESQLRQAEKMQSIGQLASGIAHEINTPIQYIGDNINFLQESFADILRLLKEYEQVRQQATEGPVDSELLSNTEDILKGVDIDYMTEETPRAIQESLEGVGTVARIVQAMKQFAHPGGEEKTAADINQAIESTITVTRNRWKYVADMETGFDPELPPVPCLIDELNQVMLNLIVNAADAIADKLGEGSEDKGMISISTRRDGEWAEIRVADTGSGIPEEIRERILDPFFTTKEVGKGSGQGLAIAHSIIVDKHGGTLAFETEMGKGTTFVIRLPIEQDVPSEAEQDEEAYSIC